MSEQALVARPANQFMPAMEIADAIARRNAITQFVKTVMVEGTDFGVIPGTDKPTLLKAGAEKLNTLFGLSSHFQITEKETDWSGVNHNGEPFFYFVYRCQLYRGDLLIAEADGSCNSMEKKYRYRWLPAHEAKRLGINLDVTPSQSGRISEFEFAVEKAETTGKYGKPAAYWQQFKDAIASGTATKGKKALKNGGERDTWEIDSTMYRVPNPDIPDVVNTIQKMAQKRSLVAATLLAVNASEFFTQDVEDMDIIETSYTVKPDQQKQPPTQAQKSEPSLSKNPLDALIEQSQGLLDKPPISGLSAKAAETIKGNWQKLLDLARNEGAPLIEAVATDAKPSAYLAAIVAQGTKLREFRAAIAQADAIAKQSDPNDISEWTGAK